MQRNPRLISEEPGHSLEHRVSHAPKSGLESIAIIGIGCRFPHANGPEGFWQLLRNGVDAITEVPADRFDIDALYDSRPGVPGKLCARWGGFLEQIDQFDPSFFGISPREAARMDPQQRLLLEVAWEALEDAGQVLESLAGSRTGVFVGVCYDEYGSLQFHYNDPASIDIYTSTGSARSILAGRLSYVLGVQGPSVAVDTACSSSLVAVHLACQSLWNGESRLALAGGVNLILQPHASFSFSQAKMLAPDGRCKAFDARANGFVRSDGAGVVVLKPLSEAQADGDPIYAVILGSAVNNDGRSGGLLMTPSRQGQEAVLREAYRIAGVSPGQVQYVETHGTGTSVGDPIEAEALGSVLAEGRPKDHPCAIGSVKTNFGHTEGAAGVAGLIKAALSMRHRALPPSLHFQEPNPNIPWDDLPLVVQRELGPWPVESGPALAGVSSFGISGTNVHIVLEEAPRAGREWEHRRRGQQGSGRHETLERVTDAPARAQVLTLSAHTSEALKAMASAFQAFVTADGVEAGFPLQDICYTASVRRTHHDHRLAIVAHSREELWEHLKTFLDSEVGPGICFGRKALDRERKLVFVFPGQGSQWVGMGRELLEQEPVFREGLERCDQVMREFVDWSLMEQLTADEDRSRFDEVDVIQPTIFAIQVALAALWRSWGIEADAVVGQSLGEVAASFVAGALSLEDAARVICRRSQLVKLTSGKGSMAVVGLSLDEARRTVVGYEDRVSVAVSNSPASTVLSGDTAALKEILEQLEHQDIFCSWVKVDYASHSPQMDAVRPELLQALAGLQPRPSSQPIYSTVTGEVCDGRGFDATYWVRNLREPVLFSIVVQRLLGDSHDVFLEISPHPILMSAIQQGVRQVGHEATVLPSLRRNEEERAVLLESLGALYTLGYPVNWSKLYPAGGRCLQLPSYPWQRERFWIVDQGGNGRGWERPLAQRGRGGTSGHPLLGQCLRSAVHAGTHFWEMEIGTDVLPYLDDHRVQGVAVFPAAAYIEMALAAAKEVYGERCHVLEKVAFKNALFLPAEGTRTVQLVIAPEMPGTVSFQVHSLDTTDAQHHGSWTLHASGTIRTDQPNPVLPVDSPPEEIQARCGKAMPGDEHYQTMQRQGLQYGLSFQGVDRIWGRNGEAIGRLKPSDEVQSNANTYQVHPALLDACFQVMTATLNRRDAGLAEGDLFLPVGLNRLRVYDRPRVDMELWSHARLRPGDDPNGNTLAVDVFLLDERGRVLLEAVDLRLQRLEGGGRDNQVRDLSDWLYELQWKPKALASSDQILAPIPPDQRGRWLILTDHRGVGDRLRSLLEARGETCVMVSRGETYTERDVGHYQLNLAQPKALREFIKNTLGPDQPPYHGVVHLWGLETAPPEETTPASLEASQVAGSISLLYLVQALVMEAQWEKRTRGQREIEGNTFHSPRLWLVTNGAHPVGTEAEPVSIGQSPIWGVGRVILQEHPKLRCKMVDLSSTTPAEEIQSLFREFWSDDGEDQIALRGDDRYVLRLVQHSLDSEDEKRLVTPADQPFRLEISTPGILDGLTLRAITPKAPGPGEVEIQVYAAGLNFSDVMKAMGIYPGLADETVPLGIECAGEVTAIGEGVEGLRVGNEVIAIAPFSFGSLVTTDAAFVVPKPAHLSWADAATIPIAFLTAYYALHHLARLGQGERVLIHSASGGVGLAAVQLAKQVGAEIFATAGSEEKREFLRTLGIEHVMDSRSLEFADEVMQRTDGEGIDVVLNSLAGEAIPKGLSTLRAHGRFLELGKRDIYQNSQVGLGPFKNNLSFFAIDLDQIFRQRPALVGSLFREFMPSFTAGSPPRRPSAEKGRSMVERAVETADPEGLEPLPHQVFSISEVESAFRTMAQAKHIGKIVVSLQVKEVLVAPSATLSGTFRADGTYLITGGFGGLGLLVAQWLVRQGARHLVLMGRRGASLEAEKCLAVMREAGAQIVVAKADVTQEQQVANVLAEMNQSMPPLRGIIHAAGVLDDHILLQMDRDLFMSVLAPKVSGAWNLHHLTLKSPLDFFVLFSSGASLLGSAGQANYVAANTFLDALAHYRRGQGRPALTINWGYWAGVGMVARDNRAKHLEMRGILGFEAEQGLEMMERLIRLGAVQVAVMPVDWAQLSQFQPNVSQSPLLADLMRGVAGAQTRTSSREGKAALSRDALMAADPPERKELLESYVGKQIAKVLGLSLSKQSKLDMHQPLTRLGIDSLMAVELKNRIETDLGVTLPVVTLLKGPSITHLVEELSEQLTTATPPPLPLTRQENAEQVLAKVDQLSDEEVDLMLHDLLRHENEEVHG